MADNRITKQRIKNHWTYSWWKYLLLTVLVVFGVNIFFSMTAYRSPEEKKVEIYLCNGWADTELAYADMWPMLLEVAPDQEELLVMNINLTSDDYHVVMQFTTYAAAQQGDILLLPKSEFKRYASGDVEGYYADLTPYFESGMLSAEAFDLTGMAWPKMEGGQGIYGVPTDALYGFIPYGIDPADSVLAVTAYSGNEENCVKMLAQMLERYATEKPEGYDEWHESRMKSVTSSSQIFN